MPDDTAPDWTGYWDAARHHYYRDHADSGAWGVRDGRDDRVVAVGLDKSVAAAVACLLNGDIAHARDMLDGLPPKMPGAVAPERSEGTGCVTMPTDPPLPRTLLPRRHAPQPLRIRRDWAQDAADAVLKDLLDRRGIKRELEACRHEDPAIWREIRGTLAGIIRDKAPRS